jgi:2-polyprenyl-6-hydroxyphenyl methylase/3-demethylubiquinone-9 3-methyltransferase
MRPKETESEAPTAAGADEVGKFEAMAGTWWDPSGHFRPLHVMNPTRLAILKGALCRHFGRDKTSAQALDGLKILDIGCGGGLIAEPLARMGAKVTGLDAGAANIEAAADHAERMGLKIDYRVGEAADLAGKKRKFDAVLALEIVEHVPSPADFIAEAATLVKPGGLMVVSTLNRTLAALALAKIGAEYLMRWVPPGTHQFNRFVTVRELRRGFEAAGLEPSPPVGMVYRPLKDEWKRSLDTSVNYVMWATKP